MQDTRMGFDTSDSCRRCRCKEHRDEVNACTREIYHLDAGGLPVFPGFVRSSDRQDRDVQLGRADVFADEVLRFSDRIEEDPVVKIQGLFEAAITYLFESCNLDIPAELDDDYIQALAKEEVLSLIGRCSNVEMRCRSMS